MIERPPKSPFVDWNHTGDTLAMDPRAAQQLARRLMAQHGLIERGWSFAFNRRKCSLGLCNHTAKCVELSIYFIDKNDISFIRDTLLHEIAHG